MLKVFRRLALGRLVKEVPVLKSLWSWLTDPNAQGRKRAICAVAAIVSGALRGASAAIASACTSDLIPDLFCRLDPNSAAAVIDGLVVWANQYLVPGSDLVAALMGLWGLWDARAKAAKVAVAAALVLGLALPMSAQEAQPAPKGASLTLTAISQTVITRGERREYMGGRAVLDVPVASKVYAFCRLDATGTQDFNSVSAFADYASFRGLEGVCGGRYEVHASGLSVAVAAGTSWSIEGEDGPDDPRMTTALALVRLPLPSGHAYLGAGWRGPVGGLAIVGSVSYSTSERTRFVADYDYPLSPDIATGQPRPWVLKAGFAVTVWDKSL